MNPLKSTSNEVDVYKAFYYSKFKKGEVEDLCSTIKQEIKNILLLNTASKDKLTYDRKKHTFKLIPASLEASQNAQRVYAFHDAIKKFVVETDKFLRELTEADIKTYATKCLKEAKDQGLTMYVDNEKHTFHNAKLGSSQTDTIYPTEKPADAGNVASVADLETYLEVEKEELQGYDEFLMAQSATDSDYEDFVKYVTSLFQQALGITNESPAKGYLERVKKDAAANPNLGAIAKALCELGALSELAEKVDKGTLDSPYTFISHEIKREIKGGNLDEVKRLQNLKWKASPTGRLLQGIASIWRRFIASMHPLFHRIFHRNS